LISFTLVLCGQCNTIKKDGDSPAVFTGCILTLLEFFQALNGFGSAFTARQDRKRHLSTFRTIQVATE
jgi:hypothetical protein